MRFVLASTEPCFNFQCHEASCSIFRARILKFLCLLNAEDQDKVDFLAMHLNIYCKVSAFWCQMGTSQGKRSQSRFYIFIFIIPDSSRESLIIIDNHPKKPL